MSKVSNAEWEARVDLAALYLATQDMNSLLRSPESDVIASLEAGDLKGKRIGTQWRITKTALAEFLK